MKDTPADTPYLCQAIPPSILVKGRVCRTQVILPIDLAEVLAIGGRANEVDAGVMGDGCRAPNPRTCPERWHPILIKARAKVDTTSFSMFFTSLPQASPSAYILFFDVFFLAKSSCSARFTPSDRSGQSPPHLAFRAAA
mmetsp:Transcript_52755/g.112077  ORF Transcript_52755/g.112077 Transcript_52755/m.112077 type:complete len:139 (-) Transcript_52755:3125-3541(-)